MNLDLTTQTECNLFEKMVLALITTVLWFNSAAAQCYTAFHSFLLSGTRERTEYKIKLMSWDKNYLPRQKRKRKKKTHPWWLYRYLYEYPQCNHSPPADQHPASSIPHHLPTDIQQSPNSNHRVANSPQVYILLHDFHVVCNNPLCNLG